MPMCTFLRVLPRVASSSFLLLSRISTVNDVVRAVSAEPAAEYAADTSPRIKRMPTTTLILLSNATIPKISSVLLS